MRTCSHLGLTAWALWAIVACTAPPNPGEPVDDANRIRVLASLSPLAFAVDRVCGERCTVGVLLPANRSAHDYEPSPKNLQSLDRAELWVTSGSSTIPLESRMDGRWAEDRRRFRIRLDPDGLSGGHAWLDPTAMAGFAGRLADRLALMRPEWATEFRERADGFVGEIDALKEEIRRQLSLANAESLWVTHPAWGAFCKPWSVEQVALEADGKEPSPKRLVALIERARADDIKRFLTIRGEASPAAEVFSRETGATAIPLDPMAYDWFETMRGLSAALSEPGDNG